MIHQTMETIKKSFKSHGSYKSTRNSIDEKNSHEQLPILGHRHEPSANEIMIKIDGPDSSSGISEERIGKDDSGERSFEFMNQHLNQQMDPPTQLIGQFLDKQGDEIALDMDMEMEELRNNVIDNSSFLSPSDMSRRVSFDPPASVDSGSNELIRRRSRLDESSSTGGDEAVEEEDDERVLRCSSIACSSVSIPKSTLLAKLKTRSRLQDPPPDEMVELISDRGQRSGTIRSGSINKSGLIGRSEYLSKRVAPGGGDEDDDSLLFEDFPEEYRKYRLSLLTLMQWISLILITAALVCTLVFDRFREKYVWELKLWKWEVMVLILICGRLVSGWVIRFVVFFIERSFLLRKRVLYFVYGLRKPVQNCLWLALVLISWGILFDKRVGRESHSEFLQYITKVLICLIIGTFLWLLKTLMVKVLASSFHVTTYFERIQDSLFNQYVIEALSGPPSMENQRNQEEIERTAEEVYKLQSAGAVLPPDLKDAAYSKSAKFGTKCNTMKSTRYSPSKKIARDNGISIDKLHKLTHKNVSAWNMKRLINIVRHGSLSTLDEQIWHGNYDDDSSAKQIKSEFEAKAAARKIFFNVARRGNKYIYFEDLLRFMEEDEAIKTMSLFEGAAEHRRISKTSLKNWVVNAFRERRALALTLNDTKTAVNKLHKIVNVVVAIIILVISLLILEIATSKFLLFVSSQLVLVAFVFGNTCKTVFEALIFLFIIHPFDVGDRCEIDGMQVVVEEMNVLTTVFLRYDNAKVIFPNSVLSQKPITNYYRSPDMGEAVEFLVHIATPPEKIALIKQKIVSYIESKKEHWYASPIIILKDVENINSIRYAVWFNHTINFHDILARWERRALFVEEMIKFFRELDIQYRLLPIDINVKAMPGPTAFDRMPATWSSNAVTE